MPTRTAPATRASDAASAADSPITDAASGTVRVKFAIDNPAGAIRSGGRCTLVQEKLSASRAPDSSTVPRVFLLAVLRACKGNCMS